MTADLTAQQRADLEIARGMAAAGIPIFLGTPTSNPKSKTGFWFPDAWEQTVADPAAVDRWQPGMALCGVMGHVADTVDIDPRSGGDLATLDGIMPIAYAVASTPSGGTHHTVAPMGCGSVTGAWSGIDVKGGQSDGESRGFVFLAPTVGRSKATGEWVAYRWLQVPDLARLLAARGIDVSGAGVAARVREKRGSSGGKKKVTGGSEKYREFFNSTPPQSTPAADRAIDAKLSEVASWTSKDGAGFRTVLMSAAFTLGGYVGCDHLDEDEARERLEAAVSEQWGSPDPDDLKWIEDGLRDGTNRPFRVYTEEQAREHSEAALAVAIQGTTATGDGTAVLTPTEGTEDGEGAPATSKGALSEARLAETVADDVLADRFCWTGPLGWLQWTGQRWRPCEEADVIEVVRRHFVEVFVRALKNGTDSDTIKAMQSLLLSKSHISAVTSLTRGIVRRDAAHFDQRPDLLNTPTGVIDLTTGTLLPHDPAYLMTKITGVGYDPAAVHPDWDKALEAVPEQVRPWYQLRLGQAITGHMTPDDVLVVQQGGGENGKSTLTGAVAKAIGDYFVLVSDRVLLADPGAHPTEMMELRGARLAVVEETPEERRLSVARLKKVVGTPKIEARYIRQNSVTFDATHSLFVSTNYRPMVSESDRGTWRRLLLMRFPYTFVKPAIGPLVGPDDRYGDPTLRDRLLRDERAQQAALRWLVDGALCWYANGRIMTPPPDEVVADTEVWRKEADQILAYLGERLEFDPGRHVIGTELLDDFNAWLLSHGHKVWSDKTLAGRFGDHGEVKAHRVTKERLPKVGGGVVSRLARTSWLTPPARYMGWTGVRFTEPGDKADELG